MNIDAYLKRIGFSGHPRIDVETLSKIHHLHTLSLPFENLTPFTHQEVPLSIEAVSKKMLFDQRGGYCFEHNLLLSEAMKTIGFSVKHLGGRVLMNQPEETITRRSHMLLTVVLDKQTYLVDAGFGGLVLTSPIKLEMDLIQKTPHENFRLLPIDQDYKLQAEVNGVWKTLYRFDLTEQYPIDYEVSNYHVYNHPSSHFRHKLIVAMPLPHGRHALSDTLYSVYHSDGRIEKTQLQSVDEVLNVITQKFGIKLPEGPFLAESINKLIIS
jgi:N-hydroxyarylamine O-acetyltransferase